jgi:hypothetical protein
MQVARLYMMNFSQAQLPREISFEASIDAVSSSLAHGSAKQKESALDSITFLENNRPHCEHVVHSMNWHVWIMLGTVR